MSGGWGGGKPEGEPWLTQARWDALSPAGRYLVGCGLWGLTLCLLVLTGFIARLVAWLLI